MSKLRTIAMLSGKGGSGKSTVAISICKLLSDMGIRVLLIDFDLATNGSSYFFRDHFTRESAGLWDLIAPSTKRALGQMELPIRINENFWFVPSRVEMNRKGESYDSIPYQKDALKQQALEPLLSWARQHGFSYAFIDCQAGFAISSVAAAEMSDMAILVTEADAISSDAADNLLIQMGTSLPENRRYLVNKIDIRDAQTYRNMSNVFQSLNRLPPLPFDFSVRAAFGGRRIPIDLQKPSSLLFALFETVKAAFPELFSVVEEYSKKNVNQLFQEYDQEMQDLVLKRRTLEEEQAYVKTHALRQRSALIVRLFPVALTFAALTSVFLLQEYFPLNLAFRRGLILALVTLGFAGTLYAYTVLRREQSEKIEYELRAESISRDLRHVSEELDRYRSLLWTTSKDYLVDYEVVQASRRPSGVPPDAP